MIPAAWVREGVPEGRVRDFDVMVRAASDEELEAIWATTERDGTGLDKGLGLFLVSAELSRRGHEAAHEERIATAMRDHPAI